MNNLLTDFAWSHTACGSTVSSLPEMVLNIRVCLTCGKSLAFIFKFYQNKSIRRKESSSLLQYLPSGGERVVKKIQIQIDNHFLKKSDSHTSLL